MNSPLRSRLRHAGLALVTLFLVSCSHSMPRIYPFIRPVSPQMGYGFADRYPLVESLQPTLAWKLNDKRPLTYDVCIWESPGAPLPNTANTGKKLPSEYFMNYSPLGNKSWGKVVYLVEDIHGMSHRVAKPLKPNTVYSWSVRARGGVGGKQLTAWSTFIQHENAFNVVGSSLTLHKNVPFGFRTPAQ